MISKTTKYIIFLYAIMLTSCKLEPCKDYRCVNGTPLENYKECICQCESGWDGVDCTVEDKCVTNNVICHNDGYCNGQGVCVCASGYEGDSCQLFSRNRFLKGLDSTGWNTIDTCGSLAGDSLFYQYRIEIHPASDTRVMEVYNIRGLDTSRFITVSVNKLNFDQGNDVVIGTVEIEDLFGTIATDSSTIRVTYKSIDAGLLSNCKGRWTRE